MKTIHRGELENEIKKNSKMNFLAFVQTPWHALGVDAFIKFKEEQGVPLNGLVCVLSHAQAGVILDEASFSFRNPDLRVVHYTDGTKENPFVKIHKNLLVSKALRRKCETGSDFYILATVYPKYQWHGYVAQNCTGKKPVSVLIDEGLGMYMRDRYAWVMETWSSKENVYKKVKYTYEFYIGSPRKEMILRSNNALHSFGLFRSADMNTNDIAVKYYKKVLMESQKSGINSAPSYYEDALVINTQPYFDEGQLEKENDIELIKQICLMCAEKGIKVVLKPHPREKNIKRYNDIENCIVDRNFSASQESIISNLKIKPRLVVGLCSTTLVSLRLFYGIGTASVLHCIGTEGMGKKMNNDLLRFEKVFGNIIDCPSNIEELGNVLIGKQGDCDGISN